jgi:uncharacterized membrane protein HdeD (DUF308 family)
MANSGKFYWGRVVVGGVLSELAVFVIVFPTLRFFGQRAFLASILIASAVMPLLLAIWVCRRVESRFVLHGALVGVVAALFYVALTRGQSEPVLYVVAHGLKIVGGAIGGAIASRRRAPAMPALQSQ